MHYYFEELNLQEILGLKQIKGDTFKATDDLDL